MAYLGKTPSQAVRSRYYFTASGSETSLSPSEVTGLSFTDANYVDVSLNGVALVSGTDYTATPSTNTISSLSALTASDVVEIVVYDTFSVFGGSVNGDFNISGGTLAAEAVTVTSLDVDNLRLDGNTISSTDTNGNIIIDPDGTGHLLVNNTSFGSNGTLVIQQTADSKGIAIIDSAAANTFFLENDGTINRIRNNASVPLTLETAGNEAVRIDSSQRVMIGTTTEGDVSADDLTVAGTGNTGITIRAGTSNSSSIYMSDATSGAGEYAGYIAYGHNSNSMSFGTSSASRMRIDSSGNVGIANSSPTELLTVGDTSTQYTRLQFYAATNGASTIHFGDGTSGADNYRGYLNYAHDSNSMQFATDGSERMRIDSSGNMLVGTTTNGTTADGTVIRASGEVLMTRTNAQPLLLNRAGNDGAHIEIRQANVVRGFIGTNESQVFISGSARGLRFGHSGSGGQIIPVTASGQASDDNVDLGAASIRFDDIYATTGTIQTSDQNEKQQIASLTTAEMTAAKAISKLFKTFKWNKSVTENGDAARTHAGVIAQEVQTAMTDAGLDAADYAFWCSDTWTNDDGTPQTRLGIRYPELLAFVGAATEQRMADIETRLTALENA